MPRYRTLLKNRNFVLYSVGQAFSQFGDRLVQIVLIGLVYKRWPGSTFQLAKLFSFTVIPSFFISPIAGVCIDRWNKKYVMIVSDMLRAIAILLVPLFFIYRESIIPIYVVIFFIFAFACFFLPARFSIIPDLVFKEDILLANSASSITWIASGIAGFGFGGILAEYIGIRNSLYITALVYFFSAASFLALAYSMRTRKLFTSSETMLHEIKTVLKKSFIDDFIEGLKTLFFEKNIKFVMYIFFIATSMVGALYVVGVVFIQETLQSMTKDVGIISISLFGGLLAGSYLYGKIGHAFSRTKTIFASLCIAGIFIAIFTVGLKMMKSLLFGNISAFLLGFFVSPVYISANTIVHESIGGNLRGRIFSFIGIVINMGFLLFMVVFSMLAEHIDKYRILIICGAGFAIFGLAGALAGFLKRPISS